MRKYLIALAVTLAFPATATALTRQQARYNVEHAQISVITQHGASAASGGCWGSSRNEVYWSLFGHKFGWIRIYQDGWCGNGSRITRDFGWGRGWWSWGPYCITNVNVHWGWDSYPGWKHGGISASLGVSYPWGCGGLRGGHAVIRIAANGHWDTYNDLF